MKKKGILILSCVIFIILVTTLFVSYGYITSKISGNETSKNAVYNGQIIKVEYSDGTETITSKQGVFTPGSTITKTFTIENTGNVNVKYSINLDNVTNTFERKKDITYELSYNNTILKNGMYDAKGVFPESKLTILSKDILNVGESKTYTLKINYLNSTENQIIDSGKSLSAKIVIDDSITNINSLIVYGQTIQNGNPTLEAPIKVESLGSKTKNLFEFDEVNTKAFNNTSFEIIENGIRATGILDPASNNTWRSGYVKYYSKQPLTPGTYTISWEHTTLTNHIIPNDLYLNFYGFDSNNNRFYEKNVVGLYNNVTKRAKFVLNLTDYLDKYYIEIPLFGTTSIVRDVQVELGTSATEYEPYGYKIPIKISGNNLINSNTVVNENKYVKSTNGTIATSGSGEWRYSDFIEITAEKSYYFDAIHSTASVAGIAWFDEDKNFISGANSSNIRKNKGLLTAPLGASYIRVSWRIDEGYNTNWENTIQLVEGTAKTEYEPYVEPLIENVYLIEPLRKIGNSVDYIDFNNGIVKRSVYRYTLSGNDKYSEYGEWDNIDLSTEGMTSYGLVINNLDVGISLNSMGKIICSHLPIYNSNSIMATATTEGVALHYSRWRNLIFKVSNVKYPDLTTWQNFVKSQYVSGTPITVDGVLKEGIIEENIVIPNILGNENAKNITICSDNGICASNIEVEFDN